MIWCHLRQVLLHLIMSWMLENCLKTNSKSSVGCSSIIFFHVVLFSTNQDKKWCYFTYPAQLYCTEQMILSAIDVIFRCLFCAPLECYCFYYSLIGNNKYAITYLLSYYVVNVRNKLFSTQLNLAKLCILSVPKYIGR